MVLSQTTGYLAQHASDCVLCLIGRWYLAFSQSVGFQWNVIKGLVLVPFCFHSAGDKTILTLKAALGVIHLLGTNLVSSHLNCYIKAILGSYIRYFDILLCQSWILLKQYIKDPLKRFGNAFVMWFKFKFEIINHVLFLCCLVCCYHNSCSISGRWIQTLNVECNIWEGIKEEIQ